MGEYARYNGEEIKIGTCEEMYYLRADQRHLVAYEFDGTERFRFPFPDEDGLEPGRFDDHDRGVKIPRAWSLPVDWDDHGSVQFVAQHPGYVLSIPCPEQYEQPGMHVDMPNGLRVGRNGFNGDPRVVQQAYRDGVLATIVSCGACGRKWRLGRDQAVKVAAAFEAEAGEQVFVRDGWQDRYTGSEQANLLSIAHRILAGYAVTADA